MIDFYHVKLRGISQKLSDSLIRSKQLTARGQDVQHLFGQNTEKNSNTVKS